MDLSELKIRKIIAGIDPLKAMAFVVGQKVNDTAVVSNIELDDRHFTKYGSRQYNIWIDKSGELFVWKTISDMPTIVEYDCDF